VAGSVGPRGGVTSPRWVRALSAFIVAVTVAAVVGGAAVAALGGSLAVEGLAFPGTGILYAVVGLVILRRHPRHRVGWLLAATGILVSSGYLAEEVVLSHYVAGRDVPGALAALWYGQWYWLPFLYALFVGIPLLFPTGEPLSPRWRRVAIAAAVTVTLVSVAGMFAQRLHLDFEYLLPSQRISVDNPIGLLPIDDIESEALGPFVIGALFVFCVLSIVAMITRFRRSRGVERQQMKWGVFGLAATVGAFLVWVVLDAALELRMPLADGLTNAVAPVAMGLAITRYRLWDVDRLIGRTLGYVAITAVLAALYAGVVLGFQAMVGPEDASDLVVAGATLLVAALFRPVRARVQITVDRRFNRARYDAAQVVESFGVRLRDEVDLGALRHDIEHVVASTVAPASAGLWLVASTEEPR
jgi:hypothetical protein